VTVAAVAACSSSSSTTAASGAASAASGGTGNTVNSTWPTSVTLGWVGESNATSLLQTLAPLQKLLKDKMDVTLFALGARRRVPVDARPSPAPRAACRTSNRIALHDGL
jgi:ABC-type phosphate/phosphonate transport system substrate-binding protein